MTIGDLNMKKLKNKKDTPLIGRLHIEAIHLLHAAIIVGLMIATVEDLINLDFGDLVFDLTLLGNQLLPARACILTYLENIWRVNAGIRPIKGWISHYVLKEHLKKEEKEICDEITGG